MFEDIYTWNRYWTYLFAWYIVKSENKLPAQFDHAKALYHLEA
jgi:hypothetical protein